ncbi:DPH4 homolog [Macadamia integrifolia]|uniref:DPH4 homolog n=1 Tax=Macadamia integrifolia TaxID=60698 RepID=UPI001C4E6F06|nr:DPH4 homolog [Macadamia integrifolia]XP_042486230.1 DPH4 homolog [Macadamia integrifolia]XP_042486231.1 DPH4 homolog [Macadamia integrifolia]XP_042486232.1 DPH4 homolog [Macadamia integrifolia]
MPLGSSLIQKTYYDILSVKENASYEEIRASYRSAILNSHPDKLHGMSEISNTHHESQEKFLIIQKAWEVLSNSSSRAAYDSELQELRRDMGTAEDVSLKDMVVEDVGEVLELSYRCRCGDYFSINSAELEEMGYSLDRCECKILLWTVDALASSIVLPCGSCSLKIQLTIDADAGFSSR